MADTNLTATEIAETLINGNISDARDEILYRHGGGFARAALLTIEVVDELASAMWMGAGLDTTEEPVDVLREAIERVRRCITGPS